ncbi:hypothetical protein [Pseudoxanthomonas koreensis]|uniref:hypothetical protein n=1 Tax=Pseudoxanthomonas koreensis TaxID=266061 RepID=UPI00139072F9|nr:hypothetical protein [Pseudoxanthomonas koreensis]KAF1692692.1 hypothetical protein CSC64_06810 [Pseudoxanthomonas koreensis]
MPDNKNSSGWQYESMRFLAYKLRQMSAVGFDASVCTDAASWLEKMTAPAMLNGVEYDRELIADMLKDAADGNIRRWLKAAIRLQERLLREANNRSVEDAGTVNLSADNRDAAGVEWDAQAYAQMRDTVEEWKRRALEAEAAIQRMTDEFNAENGPTHMGEPVLPPTPNEGCGVADGHHPPAAPACLDVHPCPCGCERVCCNSCGAELGKAAAAPAGEAVAWLPSAHEWLSENRGDASQDWIDGWDACRNRWQSITHPPATEVREVDRG